MKTKLIVKERVVRTTDGSLAVRYRTEIDYNSHVSTDKLLKELEEASNIPAAHFLSCFYALGEYMKEKLPLGYVLEVPFLGLFKLIANATTTDDPDEAGEQAVRKIRINFLANKGLKAKIE